MTTVSAGVFKSWENDGRMIPASTLAAMQAAQALRAPGVDVIDLGHGDQDFDTPENIKQAAVEALKAGKTKYTATGGTTAFQDAVINFYNRNFGAEYTPSEVM